MNRESRNSSRLLHRKNATRETDGERERASVREAQCNSISPYIYEIAILPGQFVEPLLGWLGCSIHILLIDGGKGSTYCWGHLTGITAHIDDGSGLELLPDLIPLLAKKILYINKHNG
jgi:hypothetical protein